MTRPPRPGAGLSVCVLLLLAACSTGPSQEARQAAFDAAASEVESVADRVVDEFAQTYPDAEFTLEPAGSQGYQHWSDCDNLVPPADGPSNVQWIARRSLVVEPQQESFPLLAPVVEAMEADGWASVTPPADPDRVVVLERDGYALTIGGDPEIDEGRVSKVGLDLVSPCMAAPDGLGT